MSSVIVALLLWVIIHVFGVTLTFRTADGARRSNNYKLCVYRNDFVNGIKLSHLFYFGANNQRSTFFSKYERGTQCINILRTIITAAINPWVNFTPQKSHTFAICLFIVLSSSIYLYKFVKLYNIGIILIFFSFQ